VGGRGAGRSDLSKETILPSVLLVRNARRTFYADSVCGFVRKFYARDHGACVGSAGFFLKYPQMYGFQPIIESRDVFEDHTGEALEMEMEKLKEMMGRESGV
jgi:hypothetical protein